MNSQAETERPGAYVDHFDTPGDLDQVLVCGGTEADKHMIEMELVTDAATPHAECPECGSRTALMAKGGGNR